MSIEASARNYGTNPMETQPTQFMHDLEARFKLVSGLADRSLYKIFYCKIQRAPILILGINPDGAPAEISAGGIIAGASTGYYENGEHDILDCNWRENPALRKVLDPLLSGDLEKIRRHVVKTNFAFHRSAGATDFDLDAVVDEAEPFLAEIVDEVRPSIVLLTGAATEAFTGRFAERAVCVAPPERDPDVNQVVFAAARATLKRSKKEVLVVQLANASMYGWTYIKHHVADRIVALLKTHPLAGTAKPVASA
jgi:hypothetical protein